MSCCWLSATGSGAKRCSFLLWNHTSKQRTHAEAATLGLHLAHIVFLHSPCSFACTNACGCWVIICPLMYSAHPARTSLGFEAREGATAAECTSPSSASQHSVHKCGCACSTHVLCDIKVCCMLKDNKRRNSKPLISFGVNHLQVTLNASAGDVVYVWRVHDSRPCDAGLVEVVQLPHPSWLDSLCHCC
jgi:hypothetical protein